jgi:Mn2+/Fe2+ NRAMP family transporter
MLLLINDRRIMGRYTNGPVMNTIAWLTVFILIFISGAMVVSSLI